MQTNMQCEWETCNKSLTNPQLFYTHVLQHCQVYVKETQAQTGHERLSYPCKWANCKVRLQCGTMRKIKPHIKSHTHEKAIACPECEYMFLTIIVASSQILENSCQATMGDETKDHSCTKTIKYYIRNV